MHSINDVTASVAEYSIIGPASYDVIKLFLTCHVFSNTESNASSLGYYA